jgi:hypothetical protein
LKAKKDPKEKKKKEISCFDSVGASPSGIPKSKIWQFLRGNKFS